MKQIRSKKIIEQSQIEKMLLKKKTVVPNVPFSKKDPVILLAYKVDNIEISDVIEPRAFAIKIS